MLSSCDALMHNWFINGAQSVSGVQTRLCIQSHEEVPGFKTFQYFFRLVSINFLAQEMRQSVGLRSFLCSAFSLLLVFISFVFSLHADLSHTRTLDTLDIYITPINELFRFQGNDCKPSK